MSKSINQNQDKSLFQTWEKDFYPYLSDLPGYAENEKYLDSILQDPSWKNSVKDNPVFIFYFVHEWMHVTYHE